jgi:uncharacterized membrane protein
MAVHGLLYPLTLITAVGCGLNAGVLFAFSSFVMRALTRLPPAQGVAAMQAINVAAVNFAFMAALFGTAIACLVIAGLALTHSHASYAPYLLAGSGLYLLGVIAVTMAFNVPRNTALAGVDPASADTPRAWTRYVAQWTAANHLRATAALAAAVSLTLALHGA